MPSRMAGWTKVGEDLGQLPLGLDLGPRRSQEGHEARIVDAFDGADAVLGRRHERESLGLSPRAPGGSPLPER